MNRTLCLLISLIMLFTVSCEDAQAASGDDDLITRVDSLAAVIASMPTFTKYIYTGTTDPWDTGGIDLPFNFEETFCEITWWGCREYNGSCWWLKINDEGIIDNKARASYPNNNYISWRCIIIDYGPNENI